MLIRTKAARPRSPQNTSRQSNRERRALAAVGILTVAGLALAGCSAADPAANATGSDDVVTIQFMQNKPETIEYFQGMVAQFEAENPNIRVVQGNTEGAFVPSLIRGIPPDVTARAWAYASQDFAAKGVFADLSDLDAVKNIDPSAQELVNSWGQYNGNEITALPFSLAAAGVIYNKEIFARFGIDVPTTWDEFVVACETLKANGVMPIYGTYKDAWTVAQGLFDYATGGIVDVAKFYAPPAAGEAPTVQSYTETFAPAVAKMATILSFTQPNAATRSYPDGNGAIARGEAAMYFQGPWALSELNGINPDLKLGTFALPMTNNPADTKARVNVDVSLSMVRTTAHPVEARKFIEFLMQPQIVNDYNRDFAAFSPMTDAPAQANPQIAGLDPLMKAGRYYQGAMTYMPPAVSALNYIQFFASNADGQTLLRSLDEDTQRVADRLTPNPNAN